MRISDWSSDVCSSDLGRGARRHDGTGRSVRHAGQKLKTQSRTRSREMRTFVSAVAAGVMLAVPALAADGDMLTIRLNSALRNLEPGGVRDSKPHTDMHTVFAGRVAHRADPSVAGAPARPS